MVKKRVNKTQQPQQQKESKEADKTETACDTEEEIGFSKWLKSEQGSETLKLFVFGNSLILLLCVSWPQIKLGLEAFYSIYSDLTQDAGITH